MSGTETKKYMELWKAVHKLEGDAVTGGCDNVIQDKITDLKASISLMLRGDEPEPEPTPVSRRPEEAPVSGVQRALAGQGDDIKEVIGA